jgi:hypothetical protein
MVTLMWRMMSAAGGVSEGGSACSDRVCRNLAATTPVT